MSAPPVGDEIGRILRGLRLDAGLTLAQVAERARVSIATVSRLENGRYLPTPEQTSDLARAVKAPAVTRRRLVAVAGELRERTAGRQVLLRAGVATAQRKFASIEASSAVVRSYSPVMVVGLLQTADYAHGVFGSTGIAADQIRDAVAARLERQEHLRPGASGPEFVQVMSEAALRWCVRSAQVMADQCAAIAHIARFDGRARIGIIPWTRPVEVFPMHGFDLYDERAVIVGTRTGTAYITNAADVRTYVDGFQALVDLADFGPAAATHADRIAADYRALIQAGCDGPSHGSGSTGVSTPS